MAFSQSDNKPPLRAVYQRLYRAWGPQDWWPGDTPLEIIIGAILTQNTAWTNVEKAIDLLKKNGGLNLRKLHDYSLEELAKLIRPAGYFNVKARRLRSFTQMVYDRFGGHLEKLFKLETSRLREALLSVNGIGPETADSILLYAAARPVFVVDAYTRRFMFRHGWIHSKATYDELADCFLGVLPRDVQLFNEFHALIVQLGKFHCRPTPRCDLCPLKKYLPNQHKKSSSSSSSSSKSSTRTRRRTRTRAL